MRQIAAVILLCSAMASGGAWAAESLPAPKQDAQSKAVDASADDAKHSDDVSDSDAKKSKKHGKKHNNAKNDDDESNAPDAPLVDEDSPEGNLSLRGDRRIKWLLYDETDVYTITTRYGYQTNVIFSPQEEIELISVGDRSLWQIIPSGNRMFIRPMEEDVITNMTVITNKHSYQFDLKSLSADKSGNIYVAQFVYPDAKKPTLVPAPVLNALPPTSTALPVQDAPQPPLPASLPFGVAPSVPNQAQLAVIPAPTTAPAVQPPVSPVPAVPPAQQAAVVSAPPNYSYTYAGSDALAPLQVYDDGHSTYLKYRDVSKLSPSIFIVDQSGKESPVNYTVKGDYVVVDVVASELTLRNDGNVVHVFNEMLNPG